MELPKYIVDQQLSSTEKQNGTTVIINYFSYGEIKVPSVKHPFSFENKVGL